MPRRMSARNAAITCASARRNASPPSSTPACSRNCRRRKCRPIRCKFRDERRYTERLKDARAKTGHQEAVNVARGTIDGMPVMIAVQPFDFLGGSLGMGVGEALVSAMQAAVEEKRPFILFVSSGGARMQEGILSLMQMPRVTIGVDMLHEAGLPYIVVLTDPTTGGVSASYAMLGDVHIAEPGALIGFTGQRVIEQTIRERLPEGFQRAEYLLDHGMIDMVMHRHELRATISRLVHLMLKKPRPKTRARPAADQRESHQACAAENQRRRQAASPCQSRRHRASHERRRVRQRRDPRTASLASSQTDRSGAGPHRAASGGARSSRTQAAAGHSCCRHQRQGLDLRLRARHAGGAGPARSRLYLAASGALPRAHPPGRHISSAKKNLPPCWTNASAPTKAPPSPSSRSPRPRPCSPSRAIPPMRWCWRWGLAAATTRPMCSSPQSASSRRSASTIRNSWAPILLGIAAEKAGIIKPGVPVVIGSQDDRARDVILRTADSLSAPVFMFGQDFFAHEEHGRMVYQDGDALLDLPMPRLLGAHQIENAAIAIAALRHAGQGWGHERAMEEGLRTVEWPARLQRLTRGVLVRAGAEGRGALARRRAQSARRPGHRRRAGRFRGARAQAALSHLRHAEDEGCGRLFRALPRARAPRRDGVDSRRRGQPRRRQRFTMPRARPASMPAPPKISKTR